MAIATKEPVDFSVGLNKSAALAYNASAIAVVKEIAKKLVVIPLSARTQASTIIQIVSDD